MLLGRTEHGVELPPPERDSATDRMSRQVGAAAIKRQVPQPRQNVGQPPSRFCRSQQPSECRPDDTLQSSQVRRRSSCQGQRALPACRPRPARRPATASRPSRPGRAGVGMPLLVLLPQQPVAQLVALVELVQVARRCQGVDRQRRHPRRQVRVDRPAAVGPHRLDQKLDALRHDGMRRLATCSPGPA